MNKQGLGAGNGLPIAHSHSHIWQHVFSRRQLMKTAAGTAGLGMFSALGAPKLAHAQAGSGEPKPIPGGVLAFGVPVHHFPLALSVGKPLSEINDPSEITDFNGFVGGVHILGEGNGTGFDSPLAFQTDMGFMQGEFIGEDGEHHNRTFVFVWMDLYNGPVGSTSLLKQVHDYSPGISANGLFWLIAAPHDAVQVNLGSGTASVRMTDVPVLDAHDIANALTGGLGTATPPIPPIAAVPATVSFDIEWSNVLEQAEVTNEMQGFTGQFWKTGATIKWSANQAGFSFDSEAPNPTRNIYSVIGREHSGAFFH